MATAKKQASNPVERTPPKLTRKEKSAINKTKHRAKRAENHAMRIILAKELRPNPANSRVVHPEGGKKPVIYTKELGERICLMFATDETMSLLRMNSDPTLPTVWTFYAWLKDQPILAKCYAHAREVNFDLRAQELEHWAATPRPGEIVTERSGGKDGDTVEVRRVDNVERTKLMVETRKWILSKERPKKYGIQPIDVEDGSPLQDLLNQFRARSKEIEAGQG